METYQINILSTEKLFTKENIEMHLPKTRKDGRVNMFGLWDVIFLIYPSIFLYFLGSIKWKSKCNWRSQKDWNLNELKFLFPIFCASDVNFFSQSEVASYSLSYYYLFLHLFLDKKNILSMFVTNLSYVSK